ncbi:hypothetical protein, partial [Segatella oris]|uniref:hypothetical protein n=1 Tax=Segatella oris TaxID=28135 RepID=UPI003612EC01
GHLLAVFHDYALCIVHYELSQEEHLLASFHDYALCIVHYELSQGGAFTCEFISKSSVAF